MNPVIKPRARMSAAQSWTVRRSGPVVLRETAGDATRAPRARSLGIASRISPPTVSTKTSTPPRCNLPQVRRAGDPNHAAALDPGDPVMLPDGAGRAEDDDRVTIARPTTSSAPKSAARPLAERARDCAGGRRQQVDAGSVMPARTGRGRSATRKSTVRSTRRRPAVEPARSSSRKCRESAADVLGSITPVESECFPCS
jgi:hypothetical protein